MAYIESAPPSTLSNVIECVWTRLREPNARTTIIEPHGMQSEMHTILPDGAMDVIATFFPDGELDETFVVGAMTQPQLASVGNQSVLGVRFLPGTGGSALGVNAASLTNDQADVRDVFKHTDSIRDAFRALRLDSGSAHALHLLAHSIGMQKRQTPTLVRQAAKHLARQSSAVRIEHIAKELRVTRQHLTRVFSEHAGLTPKLFAQICRVRALLTTAQFQLVDEAGTKTRERDRASMRATRTVRQSSESWSTLAVEFGYVDQSHLIAEVKAIIGQTPAAWQATARSNIPIVPVPIGPL